MLSAFALLIGFGPTRMAIFEIPSGHFNLPSFAPSFLRFLDKFEILVLAIAVALIISMVFCIAILVYRDVRGALEELIEHELESRARRKNVVVIRKPVMRSNMRHAA